MACKSHTLRNRLLRPLFVPSPPPTAVHSFATFTTDLDGPHNMSVKTATMSQANGMLLAAGLTGALGVTLGVLGSYGFCNPMGATQLKAYTVGNQYHLTHAIVMAVVGSATAHTTGNVAVYLRRAYICFAGGILMVSGSRYILSTMQKPAWLTKVSTAGGVVLLAGWACVAAAGLSQSS